MRRFLCVLLCAIMILPTIPITVGAETYNDLTYTKYDDHIKITGCNRNATSVDIPAEIDGLPVTEIGYRAFYKCESLTSVTIPSSITNIDQSVVFYCCGNLNITVDKSNPNYSDIDGVLFNKDKTELIAYAKDKVQSEYSIPDSVTSIGDYAFECCESLTSVTMLESVTSIGDRAFYDCSSLTSITISDSVTSIGKQAFSGCSSLTSVTIPNSVTSIGEYAFIGCDSLTSVTIPNSVTSIGDNAFYGCDSLTSVTIGTGITSIGYDAFDGTAYYKNKSNWQNGVLYIDNCLIDANRYGLSSNYSINNGTRVIADDAFWLCKSLTNVTIPNSVTSIGASAFRSCGSLNISVDSGNKNYCDIDGVLFNKNKTEIIAYAKDKIQPEYSIPSSVTSIGEGAFYGCDSLTSVTIPDSVTSIGEGVFYECYSLTSATIGIGVTNIGDYAFFYCDSLTSVNIPDSVISISRDAFCGCRSLTNITIGNSVTSIGEGAFFNCKSLTSITMPDSVTSIGYRAFDCCDSLTDIYYSGSKENWQKIIIEDGNDYLTGATIHYNSAGPPQISVSEPVVEGGSITITAETKSIDGEGELFAVGYDGGKLTASEKLRDGVAALPAEDVQTIKVFCWDSLDTMRPLCEPKTITIK